MLNDHYDGNNISLVNRLYPDFKLYPVSELTYPDKNYGFVPMRSL